MKSAEPSVRRRASSMPPRMRSSRPILKVPTEGRRAAHEGAGAGLVLHVEGEDEPVLGAGRE
jgi:hypothetical protein